MKKNALNILLVILVMRCTLFLLVCYCKGEEDKVHKCRSTKQRLNAESGRPHNTPIFANVGLSVD
jgi:hypothetical protein